MGSPCLFTRQRALGVFFYWLRVKNSNHLHTELSFVYPKATKFYLESKASLIDISSIALFKPFLIAWLRGILHFFRQFRVSLKSWPWPKYSRGLFSPQNHVLLLTFFLLQICSLLDCC